MIGVWQGNEAEQENHLGYDFQVALGCATLYMRDGAGYPGPTGVHTGRRFTHKGTKAHVNHYPRA
jgi:hypothetical protein